MLEFTFRLLMLALFVFISFGFGPAIFYSSSFLGFMLICILVHTHIHDIPQYGWLVVYGIVADVLVGVSYGSHALLYILCAFLYNIVSKKIATQHTASKISQMLLAMLVTIVMTVIYEIMINGSYFFFASWKGILSIILGYILLFQPLTAIMTFLEKSFHDYLSARNFKKHR